MKRLFGLGSVKKFSNEKSWIKPTLVVHGDASDDLNEANREGVRMAACIGYDRLHESGCVVEAVHEAVRILELYTNIFVHAAAGDVEASIMRGSDLNCGAISGITNISHPISLARLVMEKTHHKKLSGENATRFAAEHHFQFQPNEEVNVDETELRLDFQCQNYCMPNGTPIGAVAIDMHGNIAAASSSNIGAGIYADNLSGGVSVAGHGEAIRCHKTASRILAMIQLQELNARQATMKVLENLLRRYNKAAGAICIDPNGDVGIHFTTDYMPWAYRQDDEFHSGIEQGEDEVAAIEYSLEM